MIILNAIGDGGCIFDKEGAPISAPWPKDGYKLCPCESDHHLFKCLERTNWANRSIVASARWWERQSDQLQQGPEFKKGTFDFRGSGIHFYLLEGRYPTADTTHFLCEAPWKGITQKGSLGGVEFVGAARLRQLFTSRSPGLRSYMSLYLIVHFGAGIDQTGQ